MTTTPVDYVQARQELNTAIEEYMGAIGEPDLVPVAFTLSVAAKHVEHSVGAVHVHHEHRGDLPMLMGLNRMQTKEFDRLEAEVFEDEEDNDNG